MRVIVVLVILALALIATIALRKERESTFDYRFDKAEQQIEDLARDIDDGLKEE
jgi:hypothetical protein